MCVVLKLKKMRFGLISIGLNDLYIICTQMRANEKLGIYDFGLKLWIMI